MDSTLGCTAGRCFSIIPGCANDGDTMNITVNMTIKFHKAEFDPDEMNLIRGKPITEYSRNMTLCLGDTAVHLNRKDAYDQIWNAIINQVNND